MDIGTSLLLLLGVGLIVAGGLIRRRSLAVKRSRSPGGVRRASGPEGPAPREDG